MFSGLRFGALFFRRRYCLVNATPRVDGKEFLAPNRVCTQVAESATYLCRIRGKTRGYTKNPRARLSATSTAMGFSGRTRWLSTSPVLQFRTKAARRVPDRPCQLCDFLYGSGTVHSRSSLAPAACPARAVSAQKLTGAK
jgi:hypothetical protein